ncbi:MAG: hypothetical protein ABI539_13675, partial [Acidobacteriota bacterium]
DAKQLETVKDRIATERSRERIKQMTTDAERRAVSAELEKYKQEQANETILKLSEDYDKGALLVFYFADQLKGVEDSGFDIASSMREMLLSLDPAKEANRYPEYADARKRALAAREERKKNPGIAAVVENPVTGSLLEIQKVIDAKNYPKAAADLNQLAAKHGDDARIYYNLGRVASLQAQAITDSDEQKAKLLEAKSAYERVVKISQAQAADPAQRQKVDVALLSLSYVALAKIYEFYDDKTYAMGIYDAAIRLGNVPGGAHGEAIAAKQRLLKGQ